MMKNRFLFLIVGLAALCLCASSRAALKSTKVPRFDASVRKAVNYITGLDKINEREKNLVAYALLKAGVEKTDKHLAEGLEVAKERAAAGKYVGYDHVYLAGVDAMLLADIDADLYFVELQNIAAHVQQTQRPDGSWSDGPKAPGDVSMTQYGVLALWAAQRANCEVEARALDNAASWLMSKGNSDGGWGYRPGTTGGPGRGASTHNMTLAAAGSIAVGRTLLYGRKGKPTTQEKPAGEVSVLKKIESQAEINARTGVAFPDYSAKVPAGAMDDRIRRALGWNEARFAPISKQDHKIYFYYTLERAAALADLKEGWYTTYGDGLLTLQQKGGEFNSHQAVGSTVATSFAILYYMRSTKQILDKQFGTGIMKGGRDLAKLFGNEEEKKKDIGPLDALLRQMESADLSKLDDIDADTIVEKITFGSKEELVGQTELLMKLREHPDSANRQAAYYALGRTGNFSLIPDMLKGLRDPNVDVNVEALMALRYISRKPNGFGLSTKPLEGAETADDTRKVKVANAWRTKVHKKWSEWYRRIRPYEEGGGFDELELLAPAGRR